MVAVRTESPDVPASSQANMAWLRDFVKRHRGAAIMSVVTGMFGGITAALAPYIIGIIIDHVRAGESLEQIFADVVLLVLLSVFTVMAFLGQRYFSGTVAYSVNYDIRSTLFANMLTLDQGFYQRYATGDLISRMHSDLMMIWRLLAMTFSRVGSAVLTLMSAFFLLGVISLPLTAIVFIVLAISTYFQLRAGLILRPVFEQVQEQAGVVSAFVQDVVSGIQTVKTTGNEDGAAQHFYTENAEFRRRWLYFRRRNEPIGMLPNMISEVTSGVVVLAGGFLALNGELTIGNFAQFLIYLNLISTSLLQLGMIYQRYQQTQGALDRITPLLQHANIASLPDALPFVHPKGEIEFKNVSLTLGNTPIIQDVSLRIKAGSTVAIVGPTGAGKTTLVNLLARVFDVTQGEILIDGQDIRHVDLDDLRRSIASVPQTTFLFSQELHRNVRMGKDEVNDNLLDEAVHISRLSNDLAQLPEGLNTLVGEKGVMLSGGQKQRVAIARAILRDSPIMVLDDALSSVDTHTAADILSDLRHVVTSRTSIIIAHRIATVKDADHIFVLDEGRLIEQGTHEQLIEKGGLYLRMVEREHMVEEVQ